MIWYLFLNIIWKNIFHQKKRKFLDRIFFPISKCIITIDPPLNSMVAGKIDMQRQSMYCLSRVVLTWYFYALLKISETNSSRNSDAKLNSTDPSCMHIQHIFFVKKFCLGIQTNWRIQHTLQNIYRNINMILVFEIHKKNL